MANPNQVRQLYNSEISSGAIRFNRYPANAAGAAVTTGKSYAYGAWAEVLANNGVTIDHWLCAFGVDTPGATDIYLIGVGLGAAGAEVLLAENSFAVFQVTAVGTYALPTSWALPRPIFISNDANSRIAAEGGAGTAANQTINVNVTLGTRFRGAGT